MSIRIEWIEEGIDAAHPWARQWDDLALAAPQRLPMLSHAWVDAYAHTLLDRAQRLIYGLAFEGERLVAVLPLVVRTKGVGPWCVHAAASPYHEHSAWGDVLVEPALADVVLAALLRGLTQLRGHRFIEIALRGVSTLSATAMWRPGRDTPLRPMRSHRNWGSYLPVEGDWQTYEAGLSKNFRANLRKATNRSHEAPNADATFEWLTGTLAKPDGLADFVALESSGWKGDAGTAIHSDATLRAFYQRLVGNLYARGWLELHSMRIGDEIVAMHVGIRLDRRLVLLKIAYAEKHGRLSPGALLFRSTAERAFQMQDTDEIDCLTDMPWHVGWRMSRREFLDVRLYPETVPAVAMGLVPRLTVNALKDLAHRHPALAGIFRAASRR